MSRCDVTSKPHDYIIAAEADLDVAIGLLYAVVVRAFTLSCSQHIDQYFAAAAAAASALLRSTRGSAASLWLLMSLTHTTAIALIDSKSTISNLILTYLLIHRVKRRHILHGHHTIAILWV